MISTFSRFACELKNYLNPACKENLIAPDKAREKTQFIDVQRRLRIYLRALWDCDFIIKQADADREHHEENRPFIKNYLIHLPNALYDCSLDGVRHVTGMQIYRAAAAHAAAHLIYSKKILSAKSLDKWHIAMISVIEDARVETLSIRRFPGLKRLWAMQHTAITQDNKTVGDYLNRLARALLDDTYQDDD